MGRTKYFGAVRPEGAINMTPKAEVKNVKLFIETLGVKIDTEHAVLLFSLQNHRNSMNFHIPFLNHYSLFSFVNRVSDRQLRGRIVEFLWRKLFGDFRYGKHTFTTPDDPGDNARICENHNA